MIPISKISRNEVMMKVLKSHIYKDITSILASDKQEWKSNQRMLIFARTLSLFPSKSNYCHTANRLLHFMEKNVKSIPLILEIMKDEGEDEEIITNVEFLHENPTIKTSQEVSELCKILGTYIKYSGVLKLKDSFIQSMDMIDDEENMSSNIETINKLATDINRAYTSINVSETIHTFDSNDLQSMEFIVARAIDNRSPDKILITSFKGLNNLLSPGYISGGVYVYTALPANYKSGILLQSHIDVCMHNGHIKKMTGEKTPISFYISMENSMEQTILRLWALLYPNTDISMFPIEESCKMINDALTKEGIRSVILYYGYREKSAVEIGQIIQSFNDDENIAIALFLDYIKRVRPHRNDSVATSSEKMELGVVMNELKTEAVRLNIPIVTGHQLNRQAAAGVDAIVAKGGYNKTEEALGRSMIANAWDILEVAEWVGMMNIENNGENKFLSISIAKQRDKAQECDNTLLGIKQPFISADSFALKSDIAEQVANCIPIHLHRQAVNYMSKI